MDRKVMEDNPANTKTHGNEETTKLPGKRLLSVQQKWYMLIRPRRKAGGTISAHFTFPRTAFLRVQY